MSMLLMGCGSAGGFNPLSLNPTLLALPENSFSDNGVTPAVDNDPTYFVDGADLTQVTLANRPLYDAENSIFNNQPVITFDGTNDYLSCPALSLSGSGTAVVVFSCGSYSSESVIFSASDTSGTGDYCDVGIDVNGKLFIEFALSSSVKRVVCPSVIDLNTAYRYAIYYDDTDFFVTRNNIEENPLVLSGSGNFGWLGDVVSPDNFVVGGKVDSGGFSKPFNGSIGYLAIFNTDLTE